MSDELEWFDVEIVDEEDTPVGGGQVQAYDHLDAVEQSEISIPFGKPCIAKVRRNATSLRIWFPVDRT